MAKLLAAASVTSRLVFLGRKLSGSLPDAAQQRQLVRLVQLCEQHIKSFGGVAVELGINARRQAVAHHQNGRVVQRQAVVLQLPQGVDQVFARGFVLPGKGAAFEHISVTRAAANHRTFFLKPIPRLSTGFGHIQQLAQIQKMALCALLFIELTGWTAGAPFGDDRLRGHGCCCCENKAGALQRVVHDQARR